MKLRRLIIILLLIFIESTLFAQVKASGGTMWFSNPEELSKNIVLLDGEWEFYWDRLISSVYREDNFDSENRDFADALIFVPSFWKDTIKKITRRETSEGCGTYRLFIGGLKPTTSYSLLIEESPATACSFFVNGKFIVANGTVALNPENTKPKISPIYLDFYSDDAGCVELCVQVSNYFHRKGGLWNSLYFAESPRLFDYYSTLCGIRWLVVGSLLILSLLIFTFYVISPVRRQYMYLGLFFFVLAIRTSIAGFSLLTLAFPFIPIDVQLKAEYLAIWLAPIAYVKMLQKLYSTVKVNKIFLFIIISISTLIGFTTIILPIYYANRMVTLLEIVALCMIIYGVYFLIRVALMKQLSVFINMFSVLFLAFGLGSDILFANNKGVFASSFMPFMLMLFSFLQFLLLAYTQSKLYRNQLKLVDDLKRQNDAYLRFVPKEFLQLLDKQSVTDVNLGDYVEREMAISFSQIHFNKDDGSEISPEEQYTLFSMYLMKITPIIRKYNGFISKFVSHGFMALFPQGTKDAIYFNMETAKLIMDVSKSYNSGNPLHIELYSGIHFGKMILGTIGEINRLDDTVISDTVNTASRIEALAEKQRKTVIASRAAYESAMNSKIQGVSFSPMGSIPVKGKKEPIELYICELNKESLNENKI